jgi:peptidyl-prolyl cis-trans isomerase D
MFGEAFNKELAKQFKLEDAALQRVIQKRLLLNYASDLGLMITDKEVAKELVKISSFFKDGKFDKNTYINVLKQNRRTASEFESLLKQDLLVQKIQNIFNLPLSKNEIKNISRLFYSQDKVSISILEIKDIKVTSDIKKEKAFWEKTKSNYKTPVGYEIQYTKVANIDKKTKKEMKKVALKLYLKLKKDEKKFDTKKIIYNDSKFLSQKSFDKLIKGNINATLKPIYENENYIIVQLLKKIEPKILPYVEVKDII